MKISEKWLRQFVNPAVDVNQLTDRITLAGLEVEAVTGVAGEFTGVVVGCVVSREQHPDADKLSLCKVDIGAAKPEQIICGAPNVREGLKVAVATIGAVLPGNFKIKKAKLRGVESFGMICSETELGLSDGHGGIMELASDAPVGKDFREYMQLDDHCIEIGLTPNRGDAASVLGVARDVAALFDLPIQREAIAEIKPTHKKKIAVTSSEPVACPRYFGCVIDGIDNKKTSPLWLQEKLRRAGLRAINPVVDVTNFVMLELGQPCHAFDVAKLPGAIGIRFANNNENLELLNGETIKCTAQNLLITSADKPVALAGVMGGANSEVSAESTSIFIESAYFDPIVVRRSAKAHHLTSDASYRYERGADWQLPETVLKRVCELLLQIVGGSTGPITSFNATEALGQPITVELTFAKLHSYLGLQIAADTAATILQRLGFVVSKDTEKLSVEVPSYRSDVRLDVDLIEEIGRIHGYDKIPSAADAFAAKLVFDQSSRVLAQLRAQLVAMGYSEAVNYSFVDPKLTAPFSSVEPMLLANPMAADQAAMRTSVVASLISNANYNIARQQNNLALFELGKAYLPANDDVEESSRLAMLITGDHAPKQWASPSRPCDFYDLKGDIDVLLQNNGVSGHWQLSSKSFLHPGQAAEYFCNGQSIGYLGKLHPSVQKTFNMKQDCFILELNLAIFSQGEKPVFAPVSKFPAVKRDLAFLLDESVQIAELERDITRSCEGCLKELVVFDVYRGDGVPDGQKSVAIGLILQNSSQTLDESEITAIIQRVIALLQREFKITLRA